MAADVMPPLPPGFVLDAGQELPPLPPGFVMGDAPAKEPSWYQRLGGMAAEIPRQVGLTARGVASGLAGVADMVPSAVNPMINAVTGSRLNPTPVTDLANRGMNAMGIPQPDNAMERVVQAGVGGMSSGLGMAGGANLIAQTAASPLAKSVAAMMAQAPSMQAASGAGSGLAGRMAAESGAGPGMQTLAALAGGFAPSLPDAAGSLARGFLRGGDKNLTTMAERAANLKEAGVTTPSVGQVTGSRQAQATESILSKLPGSAGPMQKAAEKGAAEMAKKVEQLADDVSKIGDPVNAGKAIEKGLTGEGGFMQRFKAAQNVLYNKLDEYIPKQRGVNITRTKEALADMNADIPNAPELSKWFKNAKILGLEGAMKADTAPIPAVPGVPSKPSPILQESGKPFMNPAIPGVPAGPPKVELPYESIKKLRTLVGAELENHNMASDVPRSKWKALYASLSQDLDDAAKATGNKDAIEAMKRANKFTRAGHERIDNILNDVESKKIAEQVYKAATTDMKTGASRIQAVMKSLEPTEREIVKSSFIRQMGLANPGAQNAAGDIFSPQKFLTKWNNMAPSAKDVLFSSADGSLRKSLDSIAKTAEYIKEGSKVFANPSGTAPAGAAMSEVAAAASALTGGIASGHPLAGILIASGVAAQAVGLNITAKMMTNPAFVKWLEKSVKLPPAAVPAALSTLAKSAENQPDDVQAEIQTYAQGVANAIKNLPGESKTMAEQLSGAKP